MTLVGYFDLLSIFLSMTIFFLWTLGLMFAGQVLYHLSHSVSPFCVGYFQDRVSWTISWDWPQTKILLILSSQVARITGLSCWLLAILFYLFIIYLFGHIVLDSTLQLTTFWCSIKEEYLKRLLKRPASFYVLQSKHLNEKQIQEYSYLL
jgi:hypothetical protein